MNVDFAFGGDSYTAPPLSAVNFVFPDAGFTPRASGFYGTKFGTHRTDLKVQGIGPLLSLGQPYARQTLKASGFAADLQFGQPLGPGYFKADSVQHVSAFGYPIGPNNTFAHGFSIGHFGVAIGPNNAFASPVTQGARLGAPAIPLVAQSWSASKFGAANAIFRQVGAASGWVAASVPDGAFASTSVVYAPDQMAQAHGWNVATLGEPSASWPQSCEAAGHMATSIGQPGSGFGGGVTAFVLVSMGLPSSSFTAMATHFRQLQFGVPWSATNHAASGVQPRTRFGQHRSIRPCVHEAKAARIHARFGIARVARPAGLVARGLRIGGRFGQPRTGCHA